MLSARELDPARLPSNAQTWVNLHLLSTPTPMATG